MNNNPFNADALAIIGNLTDSELIQLINDYQLTQIPEDSIVRKVVIQCFGKEDILVLQMNQLLWYIILVMKKRFEAYSPHITK